MNIESSELSKQLHCYRSIHITMEVSVNKSFPIKSKTQAKLGHSWLLLGFRHCRYILAETMGNFTLLDFGLNLLKYRITCWTNV